MSDLIYSVNSGPACAQCWKKDPCTRCSARADPFERTVRAFFIVQRTKTSKFDSSLCFCIGPDGLWYYVFTP